MKQPAIVAIKDWVMSQDSKTLSTYHRILRSQSTYQIDEAGRQLLAAIGQELDNRHSGVGHDAREKNS